MTVVEITKHSLFLHIIIIIIVIIKFNSYLTL
jgi:hypothetical protein